MHPSIASKLCILTKTLANSKTRIFKTTLEALKQLGLTTKLTLIDPNPYCFRECNGKSLDLGLRMLGDAWATHPGHFWAIPIGRWNFLIAMGRWHFLISWHLYLSAARTRQYTTYHKRLSEVAIRTYLEIMKYLIWRSSLGNPWWLWANFFLGWYQWPLSSWAEHIGRRPADAWPCHSNAPCRHFYQRNQPALPQLTSSLRPTRTHRSLLNCTLPQLCAPACRRSKIEDYIFSDKYTYVYVYMYGLLSMVICQRWSICRNKVKPKEILSHGRICHDHDIHGHIHVLWSPRNTCRILECGLRSQASQLLQPRH